MTIKRNDVAVDITDWEFTLSIIKYDGSIIDVPVTIETALDGEISWELTAAVSATIAKGRYELELNVVDDDGNDRNYIEGYFEVQ